MTSAFRCSAASEDLTEPIAGTASTVRAFLLVEENGPWGVDAVRDSRLPDEVKQRLRTLAAHHRVRPLLVRRHGPRSRSSVRVFAGYVHTDKPWLQTAELSDVREVLDLDLSGLADGASPGLRPHDDPVYLVCTHGRHDACCAERGRPLCSALTSAAPEETWEVSHIGGDRFAANVLVLPHGLYYGRLTPADADGFVARHRAGELDVDHLRGRCAWPFSVQAAEVYLRKHLGELTIPPLELESGSRNGEETEATFVVEGERWNVRVLAHPAEPRQLTCRSLGAAVGTTHVLLGITR
ncbi:MAG TPA: sucrase ferredoxin [Nocardioidaceae bacterium]|nr:sucrase ferredoxin [Nocardioidaceae bacterium]